MNKVNNEYIVKWLNGSFCDGDLVAHLVDDFKELGEEAYVSFALALDILNSLRDALEAGDFNE